MQPSYWRVSKSQREKADYFYKRPEYIEKFIIKVNKIVLPEYKLRPWTINRAVSLFNCQDRNPIYIISYEAIEDAPYFYFKTVLRAVFKDRVRKIENG
jgi:hypothetical protein